MFERIAAIDAKVTLAICGRRDMRGSESQIREAGAKTFIYDVYDYGWYRGIPQEDLTGRSVIGYGREDEEESKRPARRKPLWIERNNGTHTFSLQFKSHRLPRVRHPQLFASLPFWRRTQKLTCRLFFQGHEHMTEELAKSTRAAYGYQTFDALP